MISGMMILPNGVDIEKFNQINKEEARNYVKTRFKIDLNAELKLIFVGRIAKEKGLIYLIDALKFLDDVELLVVGGGPEEANMKEHSAGLGLGEKIHFLGAVENDTIPLVLNAADIFVLPSLSEGFSNSLLEAMACDLPSIVTDVGAGKEIVTDKVVNRGSAEQIAEAVKQIWADYGKYRPREVVKERYSFEIVAEVAYHVYSDVCEKELENVFFASLKAPPYSLAGLGIQTFGLARELAKRCDVTILTSNVTKAPAHEKIDNVYLCRVTHINILTGRPFYSLAATLRGLRMQKFDIVDGRNWEGGLAAVLMKKVKGNRAVASFRGEGAFEGPWIKGIVNKYVINNADLITATDRQTFNEVKKLI
jgi:hypothetical protein